MINSFRARSTLNAGERSYEIWSLAALPQDKLARLPYSLKILLENLLRFEDGVSVTRADIEALLEWNPQATPSHEIAFTPARVILQDFTGVPCVVDLAAMRDAIVRLGGSAERVNPLNPAELVIDHSVQVDEYGTAGARAAHHRHRSPGKPRVSRARDFRHRRRRHPPRLPGHTRRHRFSHHHDQRPGCARLGRGWDRSRGRDAGPGRDHADPAGDRLSSRGAPATRSHGDRPGADRDRDAAQEGRGR